MHIATVCEHFRSTLVMQRHDDVCKAVLGPILKRYGLPQTNHIEPVVENSEVRIYWNQRVVNMGRIKYTQPDIIVFDKISKRILIIEIGITWYTRLQQAWDIKYGKYAVNSNQDPERMLELPYLPGKNLRAEMERINRGYSAEVIPIIVGCTGEVKRNIYEGLAKIGLTRHQIIETIEKCQRSERRFW